MAYKDIEEVDEPAFRRNSVSFATMFPELALEWCYEKNCGWGPGDFTYASGVKAWWNCPSCKRVYKAAIHCRGTKTSTCSYCSSRLVCEDNSFALLFPDLAKQWHPTKNGKRKASDFTWASMELGWWKCPNGSDHVWQSPIAKRTGSESDAAGCPFCHGLSVSKTNSLRALFPELAKQWHPKKNGSLKPSQITAHSNISVYWLCKQGHTWKQAPCHRVKGVNCPYCAGKKVCSDNSLATLFPKLAKEWHPDKNGSLTPRDLTAGSRKMVWWRCSRDSSHEWQTMPKCRTSRKQGCPYCTGKKACATNSLAVLFPEISKQWHPLKNGALSPAQVTAGSSRKVWWQCQVRKSHIWESMIWVRTTRNTKCPLCR